MWGHGLSHTGGLGQIKQLQLYQMFSNSHTWSLLHFSYSLKYRFSSNYSGSTDPFYFIPLQKKMHSQWKSYLTLWTVVFSWTTLFHDAEQQQVEETPRQPCNQRGWKVELKCKYISDFWYFHFQQDYHYGTLSEVPQDWYWYLDPFTKQSPWFTWECHPSSLWIQTSAFCCITSNVQFYKILPVLLCVL